jgi:hypothetical protein
VDFGLANLISLECRPLECDAKQGRGECVIEQKHVITISAKSHGISKFITSCLVSVKILFAIFNAQAISSSLKRVPPA